MTLRGSLAHDIHRPVSMARAAVLVLSPCSPELRPGHWVGFVHGEQGGARRSGECWLSCLLCRRLCHSLHFLIGPVLLTSWVLHSLFFTPNFEAFKDGPSFTCVDTNLRLPAGHLDLVSHLSCDPRSGCDRAHELVVGLKAPGRLHPISPPCFLVH